MKKKIIIGIVILAVVFIVIQLRVKANQTTKSLIKTATVEKKDITVSVSASGRIASEKEVNLAFQTSGQLAWVGVKLGDKVEPWQAIAKLDTKQLELTLSNYLKDYLTQRWTNEQDTQITYRDSVKTDTIRRIFDKEQFALDKTVTNVEIQDLAIKYSTLITPIGGIVTSISTPVAGVNVTALNSTFTISDPNNLLFKADIDETDIGKVKEGQSVEITFDAYPDKVYKGKISRVDFVSKVTSGGGTAFNVEVKIPNTTDLKYKLGMNGDIDIIESKKSKVLVLPIEAVQGQDNNRYVYILKNNKPTKMNVSAGLETDTEIEITKGLAEGDKVLLSGF